MGGVIGREGDMSKLTKCCVLLRFCPMDSNAACSLYDLLTYDSEERAYDSEERYDLRTYDSEERNYQTCSLDGILML